MKGTCEISSLKTTEIYVTLPPLVVKIDRRSKKLGAGFSPTTLGVKAQVFHCSLDVRCECIDVTLVR